MLIEVIGHDLDDTYMFDTRDIVAVYKYKYDNAEGMPKGHQIEVQFDHHSIMIDYKGMSTRWNEQFDYIRTTIKRERGSIGIK